MEYKLPELKKFVCFDGVGNIFGSLIVTTKTGIPVKIVFVRNRNKQSDCLYILSTSLSDAEIVRIYGNRWPIECFFKASKSFLKLGTEFQSHNYGHKFDKQYDELIEQARNENPVPETTGKKRGRKKKGKILALVERLANYKASVCLFIRNFNVPFDNNQAERDQAKMQFQATQISSLANRCSE